MIAYMHWVDETTDVTFDEGTIHVRSTKIGKRCKPTDPSVASVNFATHEGAVDALQTARSICDRLNGYITAARAAKMLGVNKSTVSRWIQKGLVPVHHRTLGGHTRLLVTDVERMLGERK